jgi:hypothetical protein
MATSFRSRGGASIWSPTPPTGDSARTLQRARHGLRDKRLAQRKVANESNLGMPQRDILPIPASTGREGGELVVRLPYTIHLDDITAATMRVRPQSAGAETQRSSDIRLLDRFDLIDLTSPGRKHADRRRPHNGGREPSKNGEPLRQRELTHHRPPRRHEHDHHHDRHGGDAVYDGAPD